MTNDNKSTDTHVDTHIDRDVYRVNKGSWIVSWSWYDENNNINVNYLVWLHWKKIMGRPTLSEPQKWRRIRRRTETRKVIRRFCLNSMEIGSNWEEMERLLAREEGYKLPAVCYSIRFFRSPSPPPPPPSLVRASNWDFISWKQYNNRSVSPYRQ